MSDFRPAERLADYVFGEAESGSHVERLALALQMLIPVLQELAETVSGLRERLDELAKQVRILDERLGSGQQ